MANIIQTSEFNNGLAKLSNDDRYRVYEMLNKFVQNSKAPGLQVKRMQRVDLWEIRASKELRVIAKLDGADVFCLAVDHHDAALERAERMHPPSAEQRAQLVGKVSSLPSRTTLKVVDDSRPRSGPLAMIADQELHDRLGVPGEWIETVRTLRTQDQVLNCGIEDAIGEERFWELIALFEAPSIVSTGAKPVYRITSEAMARAFAHGEIEQLAYNLPASSWAVVNAARRTPQLVKGGPGSGKTLVALYRALNVLQTPSLLGPQRVLYVTYTKQLRDDAIERVRKLRGSVPAGLEILTFDQVAVRLAGQSPRIEFSAAVLREAANRAVAGTSIGLDFFLDEVTSLIEWRNLERFDEYAGITRRGRGARLTAAERARLWACYEAFSADLYGQGARTIGATRIAAAAAAAGLSDEKRYDFIAVDEVQDLPTSVLAMVVGLARGDARAKHIMLVGDVGQSIYAQGFRWSDVGLRLGGANVLTLANSERSTRQILDFGSALLGAAGGHENAEASKIGGLPRVIHGFRSVDHRRAFIADEIAERVKAGATASRFAIIAHGKKELQAMEAELTERSVPSCQFQTAWFYKHKGVKLITSHSSKGLEFSEVYVPDANDGTYPFYTNANTSGEERQDLDAQDCALLYVAATRAADALTICYDREASPFLDSVTSLATSINVAAT